MLSLDPLSAFPSVCRGESGGDAWHMMSGFSWLRNAAAWYDSGSQVDNESNAWGTWKIEPQMARCARCIKLQHLAFTIHHNSSYPKQSCQLTKQQSGISICAYRSSSRSTVEMIIFCHTPKTQLYSPTLSANPTLYGWMFPLFWISLG